MKKKLFYLFVVLFTGLFAACTQSDSPVVQNEESQVVRISTQLPQDFAAATRAVTVPAGHQLRYILEVWNEAGTALVGERQVKLMSSISNASFDLTLDNGTYQFVLWADFVNTSGNEVYYNAADLQAITLKDAAMTYNNEAAAAFCFIETRQKEANAQLQVSATLKRAVALLTVKEKGTIPAGTKVAASHSIPTTLNMLTGVISGSTTAALSATDPADAASKALFTQYILTSAASATSTNDALGVINLTFTGGASRTVAIPANQPIKRNHRTNLNGYLVAANATNTTVTANVSDEWGGNDQGGDVEPTEPQAAMKVGDYIYADGSYGTNAANAIGIVFSTAAIGDDSSADYPQAFQDKTIAGYAIAIDNVASGRQAINPAGTTFPTMTATSENNGITPTATLLGAITYEAGFFTTYSTWLTNNAHSANNMTDWYIPTLNQLSAFMGMIFTLGDTPATGSEAFKAMAEFSTDRFFDRTPIATVYYASSSINSGGNMSGIRLNVANNAFTNATAAGIAVKTSTQSALLRPMLTIFK